MVGQRGGRDHNLPGWGTVSPADGKEGRIGAGLFGPAMTGVGPWIGRSVFAESCVLSGIRGTITQHSSPFTFCHRHTMSDSDGDFSDELLELAGATEKKRKRREGSSRNEAKRRKAVG
jgi:hypothetical protein